MNIVSLNAGCAWNLRFLDREEEIIYPWTREGPGLSAGPSNGNEKEEMIWAAS